MSEFVAVTNDDGDVTGYTYEVTENGTVNTYTYDTSFQVIGEQVVDDATGLSYSSSETVNDDGNIVKAGSYTDAAGSRQFEFIYDDGTLVSGTETIDGVTTTYGADFAVVSVTVSLGDTPALSTEQRSTIPAGIMAALASSDDPIYAITDDTGAFSQTTYYKADGANGVIIGYAETYVSDEDGAGFSETIYSDADWNWQGDAFISGTTSGYHHKTVADNGSYVEKGAVTEDGTVVEEYELSFGSTGDLTGGTEKLGGKTVTYGADWAVIGESVDTSGLTALTAEQLAVVPVALHAPSNVDSGNTYTTTQSYDSNSSEVTYLDGNGAILGYAFSWADDWGSSVNYHDANWGWLGGSWTDQEGNSGSNSNYTIAISDVATGDDLDVNDAHDPAGNLLSFITDTALAAVAADANNNFSETPTKYVVESGSYASSYGESSSYTFVYTENWELISGEETRGATKFTYGANWESLGSKTEISLDEGSGFALASLTDLPASFISSIFPDGSVETVDGTTSFVDTGDAGADVPVYTQTINWDWGGSETTFLNADGVVLGYMNNDSWTYQDENGADQTSTNVSYSDANWNSLGHSYNDQWGSGSSFTTEVAAANDNVFVVDADGLLAAASITVSEDDIIRTETGTSTFVNWNGESETREYTYNYDSNWNFLGGSETNGGTTIQFGPNWTTLGESIDVSALTLDTVDADGLALLPSALKAASGDTLSLTENNPWGGTETTYFDDTGAILGKSNGYTDSWGSSTNYEDANGNWLGGSWQDSEGNSGSNSSSTINATDINTSDADHILGTVTDTTLVSNIGTAFSLVSGSPTVTGATVADDDYILELTYNSDGDFITGVDVKLNTGDASSPTAGASVASGTVSIALTDFVAAFPQFDDGSAPETNSVDLSSVLGGELVDGNVITDVAGDSVTWGNTSATTGIQVANATHVLTISHDGTNISEVKVFANTGTADIPDIDGDTPLAQTAAPIALTLAEFETAYPQLAAGGTWGDAVNHSASVFADLELVGADGGTWSADGAATLIDLLSSTDGDAAAVTEPVNAPITSVTTNDGDAILKALLTGETTLTPIDVETAGGLDLAGIKLNVETGTNTFGTETNSFTYVYTDDWQLVSGVETRGSTTYEYGPDWTLVSSSTNVTGDGFVLASLTDLPASFISSIFPAGSVETVDGTTSFVDTGDAGADVPVYSQTNNWEWGGSETTYYDANGNVLGYMNYDSHTYQDENGADQTSTNYSYSDANWNSLGHSYNDQWGSGSSFTTEVAAANDNVFVVDADGLLAAASITVSEDDIIRTETGTSTFVNWNGESETREYTYNYDSNWNFLGGSETNGGTTIQFGPNWTTLGESIDVSALTLVTVDADGLALLPSALKAASGDTLSLTENNPWGGTETTYFDDTGAILGKSNGYTDDWGSNTNYEDANGNWLGGSWQDSEGNSGSNSNYTIAISDVATGDDLDVNDAHDPAGNLLSFITDTALAAVAADANNNFSETPTKYVVESGSYASSYGESSSYTFVYTENWELISGEETRGATKFTYGANWESLGSKTEISLDEGSGFALASLTDLPASFISSIFPDGSVETVDGTTSFVDTGDAGADVPVYTQTINWDWGGSETTFLNADGVVLGYMNNDSWTYQDENGADQTSTNVSYSDANWNSLGHSYNDQWGSGSSFTTEVAAANDNVFVVDADGLLAAASITVSEDDIIRTETGTSTFVNWNGESETREYTYNYDSNWNFLGGSETNGGTTIQFGPNWTTLGESIDVSALTLDTVDADGLALLPSALKAASGDTLSLTENNPWGGTETTYFDDTGAILGKSNGYTDDWGSSTNYEDANGNWLGGSWQDSEGNSGSNSNYEILASAIATDDDTDSNGDHDAAGNILSFITDAQLLAKIEEVSSDGATPSTGGDAQGGVDGGGVDGGGVDGGGVDGGGVDGGGVDGGGVDGGGVDGGAAVTGSTVVSANYVMELTYNSVGDTITDVVVKANDGDVANPAAGASVASADGLTIALADFGAAYPQFILNTETSEYGTGADTTDFTLLSGLTDASDADGVNWAGSTTTTGIQVANATHVLTILHDGTNISEVKVFANTGTADIPDIDGDTPLAQTAAPIALTLAEFETAYPQLAAGGTWGDAVNHSASVFADLELVGADGGTWSADGAATLIDLLSSTDGDAAAVTEPVNAPITTVVTGDGDSILAELLSGASAPRPISVTEVGGGDAEGGHAEGGDAEGGDAEGGDGSSLIGVKLIIETGTNTFGTETNSFTYVYTQDYQLVSGEETRGATKFTYGPNWEALGSKTEISLDEGSGFALADLAELPAAFISSIFPAGSVETVEGATSFVDTGDAGADVPVYEQTTLFEWGGGETTFLNADGTILGYISFDSYTYQDENGADQTSTNYNFSDANWNSLGQSNNDQFGSSFSFNTEVAAADDNVFVVDADGLLAAANITVSENDIIRTETGTSTFVNWNGETETREYTYNFDSAGNFLGGSENNNGTTMQFGPHWSNLGESVDVTALLSSGGLETVGSDALALLPTALQASSGDTLVQQEGSGSEITLTYLSADTGAVLGVARSFSQGTDSNINYEDANGEWIGSRYSNDYGSGFNFNATSTTNPLDSDAEGSFRIESGANYDADGTLTSSFTNVLNATTFDFLNGVEVRGDGTELVFGANREVTSQSVAGFSELPSLDPTVAEDLAILNTLPDALKATDSDGNVVATIYQTVTHDDGGTQTTYLGTDGNILGYANSYSDSFSSNTNYEGPNWEWLGNVNENSDGSIFSSIKGITLNDDGVVIGSTMTNTEITSDFTRIEVTLYDTAGDRLSSEETVTSSGTTVVSKFDANWNLVGSFDGDGNLLDPMAVFQLGSFVFESGAEQEYAESMGYTNFEDYSGSGTADVLEEDYDENGIPDIAQMYMEQILNQAILSEDFKPLNVEANGAVTGIITANANYFVSMSGAITVAEDGTPSGTITEMTVSKSAATDSGYEAMDGNNYEAGDAIAAATGLSIDLSGLVAFVSSAGAEGGDAQGGVDGGGVDGGGVDGGGVDGGGVDGGGVDGGGVDGGGVDGGAAVTGSTVVSANYVMELTYNSVGDTITDVVVKANDGDVANPAAGASVASADGLTIALADFGAAYPQFILNTETSEYGTGADTTDFTLLSGLTDASDADGVNWAGSTTTTGIQVANATHVLTILHDGTNISEVKVFANTGTADIPDIDGDTPLAQTAAPIALTLAEFETAYPQLAAGGTWGDAVNHSASVFADLELVGADGGTWSADGAATLIDLLSSTDGDAAAVTEPVNAPITTVVTGDGDSILAELLSGASAPTPISVTEVGGGDAEGGDAEGGDAVVVSDIVLSGVEYHEGAGMITLISSAGFDDDFATSFAASYDGGITYKIDGSTDVVISADDIESVSASDSSEGVTKLMLLLTPGNNPIAQSAEAANILGLGTEIADTVVITGVTGVADLAATTVLASGSGGDDDAGAGGGSTVNYTVTVEGGIYYIDGAPAPALNLQAGNTYIFDLSHSSVTDHPFALSATVDGTHGTDSNNAAGVPYEAGVTSEDGILTIVVDTDTPSPLYYFCVTHAGMGNSEVVAPLELFLADEVLLNSDYVWDQATLDGTDDFVEEFATNSAYDGANSTDGGMSAYLNGLIAKFVNYDEPVVTSDMGVNKVSFDIPLAADLAAYAEFVGAVEVLIPDWSTTGGALRVTVEGSNLKTSDGFFLAVDNTVSSIDIQAVLVDADSPANTVVEDLYTLNGLGASMADLAGQEFTPVMGSANVFTDVGTDAEISIETNAQAYLDGNPEVIELLGGAIPDGVVADIHNVTFKLSALNTDTSDDTAGDNGDEVVYDTDLNVLVDISSYSEVDDSAVAAKVIEGDGAWSGVTVSKDNHMMVMTFASPVTDTETVTSVGGPIVGSIGIFVNTGNKAAPIQGDPLAAQDAVNTEYFAFIDQFSLLDATTESTSSNTGQQGSSLFTLVDSVPDDGISIENINSSVLPDFLYADTDVANTSVVEQVRFYKDAPGDPSGTINIATLQSADVMTVEELDAFVIQQFG